MGLGQVDFLGTTIGRIAVDASLKEGHVYVAEPTQHPVEDGSAITDHVKLKAITLQMECIVSNTPIEAENRLVTRAEALASSTGQPGQPGPVDDCRDLLLATWRKREVIEVVTMFQTYKNMVITRLSFDRTKDTIDSLPFQISLQEVRIVSTKYVLVPKTKITQLRPKVSKGPQPAPVAPPPVPESTAWKLLFK